ncbi:sulfotransferase family 2 domain-containing protein [Halalkalibacterium halodurans]|nr:sulfotransferase family 2 domain-containing protein [Halalkalibacterium halodurans]MED4080651.1 sulfotransferase family 2 domain-containing protein [Halalkalibacterium halodurans]MED4085662.1 sulfotransferase family 2 domain-containing protein [Halalkalibacterium halodurans]MED4106338.1 sulfotransferase family 2 domain-containing protein [Halalkalibacterium halodurans]MED4108534.1 sulfotransferase family 2 domain-containing protein [Halalkalibacterium halodurans]MED4124750.1 sulfotransferas
MPSNLETVLFLHIPKTGGLTLRGIIEDQYAKDERLKYPRLQPARFHSLPKRKLTSLRCVYGHFGYGIHSTLHQPFTYITILRDPVERVISTYYFVLQNPQNRLHHQVKQMSFEQFVASDLPVVSNHQTRLISGKPIPHLALAKKHLNQHFSIVGITDMYAQSIFLMSQRFGWKNVQYTKKNKTKHRLKQEDFSQETIATIRKRNELDLALYDYAKDRLQRQLHSLDSVSERELEQFIAQQEKR